MKIGHLNRNLERFGTFVVFLIEMDHFDENLELVVHKAQILNKMAVLSETYTEIISK